MYNPGAVSSNPCNMSEATPTIENLESFIGNPLSPGRVTETVAGSHHGVHSLTDNPIASPQGGSKGSGSKNDTGPEQQLSEDEKFEQLTTTAWDTAHLLHVKNFVSLLSRKRPILHTAY